MYRFIDFNDEKIDSMLLMELSDLCKTLGKDARYEADFRVHSYLNKFEKKIYVSHFWNHRDEHIMRSGMKSDVYLRALGNAYFTNYSEVLEYQKWCGTTRIPQFARQLFTFAEDFRIEERCIKIRPGMKKDFHIRRNTLNTYFQSQMKANLEKSLLSDGIFNFTYLILNTEMPIIEFPPSNERLSELIPLYRIQIEKLYDTVDTQDVKEICMNIVELAQSFLINDMIGEYFHLPSQQLVEKQIAYGDLLRKDPLQNHDIADNQSEGDETVFDEEMKTWHRETSSPGKTFMQFNLDQGTQTDIVADGAREGEAGDQALAIVQGSSKKSTNKDFSDLESLERQEKESGEGSSPFGHDNKHADAIFTKSIKPTNQQKIIYQDYHKHVILYQKKLKKTIDLTLEHKKSLPQSNMQVGRLDKKLLRFFTDEQLRLFYKKQNNSNDIDAAFSLLIDCSASMQDKMEETKKGIILFHEALKAVKVPHEVTGFWEDASYASNKHQPNYFKQVINYQTSLLNKSGPEIMDLRAEEDNRDGFAIRVIGQRLIQRFEKQKFLIIFSDGEPAAFNYSQNGIVDTHEAVSEMRKKGVEVFNIFLSNEEVGEEQRKVFTNIYGAYSIIVPSLRLLPELLFPLLKRLLAKSI